MGVNLTYSAIGNLDLDLDVFRAGTVSIAFSRQIGGVDPQLALVLVQ